MIAHALFLLPNVPRLTSISKVGLVSTEFGVPIALLEGRPDGLAVAMAKDSLPYLRTLELTQGSAWRFAREEPHRTVVINALSSGGLPRLTSFTVDDADTQYSLLEEAFQGRTVLPALIAGQG